MGMIRCNVHGLSPITQYCTHIGDAVDDGHFEQAFVEIDGWNNPNVLCSRCHPTALAVIAESREHPGEPFDFDFGDETSTGGCSWDLEEWMAATGQGKLTDAVLEARARDGRPGP